MTMPNTDDLRFAYDRPELSAVWTLARTALESPAERTAIIVELSDRATKLAVGDLLGLRMPPVGRRKRITLTELDAELRASPRLPITLADLLEVLHGRPVQRRESAQVLGRQRRDGAEASLSDALRTQDLHNAPWADAWIDQARRYGKIDPGALPALARQAVAVLAEMDLGGSGRTRPAARGDLAARLGGGAHALDDGRPLARLVLRGAALAREQPYPQRSAQVRA
ncbi:MAG: TIGR02679 domain-containing protein, partial [Sciscionella sp.]